MGHKKELPKLCTMRHNPHTLTTCIKKYLNEHPMFDFFGGVPLVISIVAPFTVFKSLSQLFLQLAEQQNNRIKKNGDCDDSDIMGDEALGGLSYAKVLDMLECCTEHFLALGPSNNILEMWYLIGVNGPGILDSDLQKIICAKAFLDPNSLS